LRTSLTLAAILNQPVRIKNIRVGRKNPGLAAQHLTTVRATAMICEAELSGDGLGPRDFV
jgi:RNA 3'-terminal phosphate cyclase (ATP)